MFAGNEFMWILIIVGIPLVIVWAVARQNQRRNEHVVSHTARLRGTPADVADDLVTVLGHLKGVTVNAWPDGMVLLERRTLPGWSIAVAILGFPFGILALMARNVDTGAVLATPATEGTVDVHLRGRFDPRDVARINEVISARS